MEIVTIDDVYYTACRDCDTLIEIAATKTASHEDAVAWLRSLASHGGCLLCDDCWPANDLTGSDPDDLA